MSRAASQAAFLLHLDLRLATIAIASYVLTVLAAMPLLVTRFPNCVPALRPSSRYLTCLGVLAAFGTASQGC
eukprot:14701298-Alexandrium_andersonii.AAC.1